MASHAKSRLAGIQEKTLRFKVWPTKGALPQEFYFIIKNRELVKWGDGTFGVVYEVRQSKGDSTPYVVKLLYASKAGKNSKLSRSDLENIKLEFDREFSDITEERKQFVETGKERCPFISPDVVPQVEYAPDFRILLPDIFNERRVKGEQVHEQAHVESVFGDRDKGIFYIRLFFA